MLLNILGELHNNLVAVDRINQYLNLEEENQDSIALDNCSYDDSDDNNENNDGKCYL